MSNYKVAFFMAGFRDLSPGLKVSDKSIWHISQVRDEVKRLLQDQVGEQGLKKLWGPSGLPCAAIDVAAADPEDAIRKAWPAAQRIVDALALIKPDNLDTIYVGIENKPRLLSHVLVANLDDDPPTASFSEYIPVAPGQFNVGVVGQVTKSFNERIVRHILSLMPSEILSPGQVQVQLVRRLAHSLHWYSQGINQPELALRFLAAWIALESLVIESTQTEKKRRKIVNRLNSLAMKHNNGDKSDNVLGRLWTLRSNIVHEAIGGILEPDAHNVTTSDINQARYFYLLALLFVLDCYPRALSLTDAWGRLDGYQPSFAIKWEEMPQLIHVVHFRRYRYPQ